MSSEPGGLPRVWKDALLWTTGLPWRVGFGALGRMAPRSPEHWSSPGGQAVLVVAPHPDDEVAGCAGTILLHRARGDRVTVAHATDGARSRALGLPPGEMARRRRGEAEAAAALLDVDLAWIGLPEGDWQDDELVGRLETLIERTSADLVYAPSRVDFHPEHRRVASSLARALERRGELLPVRVYEVQVPLTGVLVNRVADTSRLAIPVRRAVRAYATQLASLRRTLRSRRYAALRYRVGREAEVFWEISSLAYAALHPSHPETAPSGFRGIRQLPLTDPLAYLTGRDERRRLSLAAADPDLARAAAR